MRKINTGDVFKMARLLKNANVMDVLKHAYKSASAAENANDGGAGKGTIWVDAAMTVLASCTSQQAEEQVYDLMAGICECKPEDVRDRPLDDLIGDIKQICEENNVANFFHAASDFAEKL